MGMYNVETAKDIAYMVDNVLKENQALVNIVGGCIGIATRNERGYHDSNLIVTSTERYDEIGDLVDEANAILFPNRDPKETAKIVLSSMRG